MALPEVIATDGELTLRRLGPADLDRHLESIDDEQITWLWGPGEGELWQRMSLAQRRQHQLRYLQAVHNSFGKGPKWCFGVDAPGAPYVVYIDCDLASPDVPPGQANISYACAPAFRGRGYTQRAVRLLSTFLRTRTEATEGHIVIDAANHASLGVARALGAGERESFVDARGHAKVRHVLDLRDSVEPG